MELFFSKTLSKEAGIAQADAAKAAKAIAELCSKTLTWPKDE